MTTFDFSAGDIFDKAINRNPSKPFIVFGDTRITYRELGNRIGQLTAFFNSLGIKPGNRLVFSSRDESLVSTLYMALIANGITAVNLDPDSGEKGCKASLPAACQNASWPTRT
ncbi:MAG: AMP-binding protein [Pseudomonadota bacterium]